jgi:hypothetical protein
MNVRSASPGRQLIPSRVWLVSGRRLPLCVDELGLFGTTAAGAVPRSLPGSPLPTPAFAPRLPKRSGELRPNDGLAMPELERVSRDSEPGVRLKAVEGVEHPASTWQSRPFFMRALSDSTQSCVRQPHTQLVR